MSSQEIVVQGTEIVSTTLFGTDNPGEVVERASKVARTLEQVVRTQNLVVRIGQSEHVRVEGWTFLGSMLGVFPVVEWTRPVIRDDEQVGWEARVEARTRSGEVVGAAEAECLVDERTWKGRDDYARRSMAQTRAVSKALRLPLGFVMQLAGFDPTPAEEMPRGTDPPERDVPFDDVSAPPPAPASDAQKRKLNVLVGKLRPSKVSTDELWRMCGRPPQIEEDGESHWSPLRDQLKKGEASRLIEALTELEGEGAEADSLAAIEARLLEHGRAHGNADAVAAAITKARASKPAPEFAVWLRDQGAKLDAKLAAA